MPVHVWEIYGIISFCVGLTCLLYCFVLTQSAIYIFCIGYMPSVLEDTKRELCKLSEDVNKISFNIVFGKLVWFLDVSNIDVSRDICKMSAK